MRDLIIVDCESTGLRPRDIAVEVAWLNVDTGACGNFIPEHDEEWVLYNAEPIALEINGYRDRILGKPQAGKFEVARLHNALTGQSMAGSNPRADAGWLATLFEEYGLDREPFHYRLPDIASYAAGVLGINVREMVGLQGVCERLGVQPGDHSAMGDVKATAEAFRMLEERNRGRS